MCMCVCVCKVYIFIYVYIFIFILININIYLNMVSSDLSSYQAIIKSANSLRSFNRWSQRSTVLLCPSNVGAPSHSGTVIIGWLFILPTILFSSMVITTKALSMMEIPTYLTEIHMLLQIVGGITSLMKSWKSLVNYGEIIIS